MKSDARRYGVVGTGAIGGYYGARLAHSGAEVHFLLHSDYRHVRKHGLRVESKFGDFSIARPNVYGSADDMPPCEVVLVALKTTDNGHLERLLPPLLADDSVTVLMQNGLGAEERVAPITATRPLLGGLAFVCSNKEGPGFIRHLDYGAVRLAEFRSDGSAAGMTESVRAVGGDLRRAGVEVILEEDLAAARWKKLVWNIPFNGMCALHRCTTDVLLADATLAATCETLMGEVIGAARACGKSIADGFAKAMMRDTAAMTPYKPSMLLDVEAGRPLELDAIYAAPLAAAQRAGAHCSEIRALYERLLSL